MIDNDSYKQNKAKAIEVGRIDRSFAAKLVGVQRSTYKLIELGVNNLTLERAKWFVAGLGEIGIKTDVDWVLDGVGSDPERIRYYSDSNISVSLNALPSLIQKELDFFTKHNKNSFHLVVTDDEMSPVFIKNDVVAGIVCAPSNFSKLLGLNCIVKLDNGKTLLRNLSSGRGANLFTLVSLSPYAKVKVQQDIKPESIAPVLWHRRNLEFID